ncbi:MAG: OsmC family protein [Caulobacteraceae bacterium]
MAVDMTYEGDLRCRIVHGPSGDVILTDAPPDHEGRGESFSPTDLLAASLGSCILSVMATAARVQNVPFEGASARVEKTMRKKPSHRVEAMAVTIRMPHAPEPLIRTKLERAAATCPVKHALSKDLAVSVAFVWG